MTITGHQLNFLPGVSVINRIAAADVVIWLDCAQYVRHSFVNRNRLSDNQWMTVPVNEHDTFAPINRVRIADETGRAREKVARSLEQKLGHAADPFAEELRKPYRLLVGLNYALMQRLFEALGIETKQVFQSMLDPHHPMPVVSDDESDLLPVRERFADWTHQLGGDVWLSGPSKHHGPEEQFSDLGIELRYFDHEGPNPSALELLKSRVKVAA